MNISTEMPEDKPLRWGYTTGACATAASSAALQYLITGVAPGQVQIVLPQGQQVFFVIERCWAEDGRACASVIKDGGDDPDVTHGLEIQACVALRPEAGTVFVHGIGVGRVTLPGLETAIGDPAINPVPRKMISAHLAQLLAQHGIGGGTEVQIRVPRGQEVARQTFNPRLGIVDGISILGTTGLVKPYSSEAFVESIRRGLLVARALGCREALFNSGGRSEAYLRAYLPGIPECAFVQYGNWIGEALVIARELGFSSVTMGMMLGKAVKLAEGHLNTHSKESVFDPAFLCRIATETSYLQETVDAIQNLKLARNVAEIIPFTCEEPFYIELARLCASVCTGFVGQMEVQILFVGQEGEILDFRKT